MFKQTVNYTITPQNIVLNYNGETHIVSRTDALAERLLKALKENKLYEIPNLVSAANRIKNMSKGAFEVQDGNVVVNGVAVAPYLSNKIVHFSKEGLPFQPLLRFAEKLGLNPSFRAVNELYEFLEKNNHPLTESGNFIAYKRVRSDFTDIHSGTFDNSVGSTLRVSRNQVDEDSTKTCSYGLHVANWYYAHTQFSSYDPQTDIMLEVEVDPADVVAIPADYNQSKIRVCAYKVLGVVSTPFKETDQLRVVDEVAYQQDCQNNFGSCNCCGSNIDSEEQLCSECAEEENACFRCGEWLEDDCDNLCYDCKDLTVQKSQVSPAQYSSRPSLDDDYPYEDELD